MPTMCRTNVSYAHPPTLNLPIITAVTPLGGRFHVEPWFRLAGNISMSPFRNSKDPHQRIMLDVPPSAERDARTGLTTTV